VIYIKGFSGDLVYQDRGYLVKESENNVARLLHQAHKQEKYRWKLKYQAPFNSFDVPYVVETFHNGYKMEYVDGYDILTIMQEQKYRLPTIADKVLKLIDFEFSQSVKRPFRVKPFIKKLSPVCPPEYSRYLIQEAKKLKWKWIDYGLNHGDMSMANMIFKGGTIYLIDFLKTFLRTPYQDIAKLQQEMDLHWAMLMSDYSRENFLIKQGYDYLSHRLNQHLKRYYSDRRDIIRVFHFMCLCRLFPYAKNDKEIFKLVEYRCQELMDNEDSF